MNTITIVNKLCDADLAKTSPIVKRARAAVNIGVLTKAFNKTVKKQLLDRKINLA